MSQSGVNYFLSNYASFPLENWQTWLDFKSSSSFTFSRSGAQGSGYAVADSTEGLPYDYRYITPEKSFLEFIAEPWDDQFTLMFLNEKLDNRACILYDYFESGNLGGENVYKGYQIGYTDGSKPYFFYQGPTGPETYVADFSVTENHSLYVMRNYNNITIGVYDFLTQETNNNSFQINSDFLFKPVRIPCFGNLDGVTPYHSGKQIIDEFMYFSYPLYDYDIQLVNSGWAADYTPATQGTGYIKSTGIVGFSTGITYQNRVTGWNITGTGFLTNEFGVAYTGYLSGEASGLVPITTVTPITGEINTAYTFDIPAGVFVNSGFLRKFYSDYVTFLRTTDPLDINSIFFETGAVDSLSYKDDAVFDSIRSQFKIFAPDPINLYLNGIANFSGNKTNVGTIYQANFVLSEDYYRTGNYLDSTGFYDQNDYIDYRMISGTITYQSDFYFTSGNLAITPGLSENYLVFGNGQKLISGVDYNRLGSSLLFINNNSYTGDLSVISLYGKYAELNGNFAWTGTRTGFNPNYTMVYMNGQRMIENNDFVFSDKASMLDGSGTFLTRNNIIVNSFNNNDPFFN